MDWGNLATAAPQEGDIGNGLSVELISDVPVVMGDTYWQWLDGPMYVNVWVGNTEAFAGMCLFLEQLIAAQAAEPLSTTDWWYQ